VIAMEDARTSFALRRRESGSVGSGLVVCCDGGGWVVVEDDSDSDEELSLNILGRLSKDTILWRHDPLTEAKEEQGCWDTCLNVPKALI